jgi:NADH dehydrogenase [ubiquinone] 1 alpha subcomplex assembly factor 6
MAQETLSPNRAGLSRMAALVRARDRDRFQAALFAPARHRETLFALYAFNYEIARVREAVREPMLGQIRLQWWRDVIDAAYAGGRPRRHEAVEAVTAAIRAHGLSRAHFDRLIDTREQDFDPEPPADLAALEAYAEGSAAPLVLLALEVLGGANAASEAVARDVGVGYGLAGILRALPHMEQLGRGGIPADIIAKFGLDRSDLGRAANTAGRRAAVAAIAAVARQHLAAARARRCEMPAAALPALLPAVVAANGLRRLERAGFDPYAPEAAALDPLQPWRLAVAALTRRF